MLSPTPPDVLTDASRRPYFLWDCDLTIEQFQERLRDPDPDVRAYFIAKLMRQAKPDDVFQFVRLSAIRDLWPRLTRYLGQSRPFWTWLLDTWSQQAHDGQSRSALIDGTPIAVDSMHEILVNKITALLGRTELRDLVDVQALLDAGVDLTAALRDAPKKDAGFSAMTLAWVLHTFETGPLARALNWSPEEAASLDAFRLQLIDRLTRAATPE